MKGSVKGFVLLAMMLTASGLAVALRPHQKIAEQRSAVDLNAMIPRAFGDWREEPNSSAQIVDPQQKELLNRIYSQMLARTYRNAQGYRIMLSVTYGSDQSDTLQVHNPEVCYPAQGFVLAQKQTDTLSYADGPLLVNRFMSSLGARSEPVTYWIIIGDRTIKSGVHKKFVEMSYGLTGKIPDGMLVRISSIDTEPTRAYVAHNQFATQMLAAVDPTIRERMIGVSRVQKATPTNREPNHAQPHG